MKNPIEDIDNWTIDQLSRISATMGLTRFECDTKNRNLVFKEHTIEPREMHNLGKVKIANQIYSILIPNNHKKDAKPFINFAVNDAIDTARTINELRISYIKSAIAAIMARNMSHNIGSHILSTLGYEGQSVADDRVLYKYLQQRMDYIAQISTEIPKWTYSAWFLSDIMRRFYMQENLLTYLGHSEGLTSYSYKKEKNKGAIEIRVCKKKKDGAWGKGENVIPGNGKFEDFQVAIPGGIVGYHAFYTILENFIRNAAKHDWAKANRENIKNLVVTIEFENNPDKYYIPFVIYYNIPLSKKGEEKAELLKNLEDWLKDDFIDDKGELKKENWGLKEMRISAGYLLKKQHDEIGLGKENILFNEEVTTFSGIIKVDTVPVNGNEYLGYRFAIYRPKEVLFIGTWADIKKEKKELAFKYGVQFKNEMPYAERDYNFILFDGETFEREFSNFEKNQKNTKSLEQKLLYFLEQFPGRVIVMWNEGQDRQAQQDSEIKTLFEGGNSVLKKRVIALTKGEFNKWFDLKAKNINFSKLKFSLSKMWIDHWRKLKGKPHLGIFIELGGSGQKEKERLEHEILKYIVEKHLKKICETIHGKSIGDANISFEGAKTKLREIVIELIKKLKRAELKSKIELLNYIKEEFLNDSGNKIFEILDTNKGLAVLGNPEEEAKKYKKSFESYAGSVIDIMVDMVKDLIFKDEKELETLPVLFKERYVAEPDISDMINKLTFINESGEWEKKIVSCDDEEKADIIYRRHDPIHLGSDEKVYCEALSGSQFFFNILFHTLTAKSSVSENKFESHRIILQLLENALLEFMIIDERVRNFYVKNFENSLDKYRSAKIGAPCGVIYKAEDKKAKYSLCSEPKRDSGSAKKIEGQVEKQRVDTGVYIISQLDDEDKLYYQKIDKKPPDVFIIHQGIIDKMGFKENEKDDLDDFIDIIKNNIPYVFVTSGRGKPHNIPENTKLLPFSSIEAYLMSNFPEKNLLTQILMQIFWEEESEKH